MHCSGHCVTVIAYKAQQESWAIAIHGRAMRPIYGCTENFRESLTTPTATFPEILIDFCSDRSIWICVPKIIRVLKKLCCHWIRQRCLFSKIFMAFCSESWDSWLLNTCSIYLLAIFNLPFTGLSWVDPISSIILGNTIVRFWWSKLGAAIKTLPIFRIPVKISIPVCI